MKLDVERTNINFDIQEAWILILLKGLLFPEHVNEHQVSTNASTLFAS
jgi:hypothetical protein